ncbi:mechanosensitive ion channel family protein [Trichocoleus sp. FACHB-262]|uniref:mechanosensitive ion channel family protein n=1 Tax=Trichocoleus sp. FACHB-262 TaxID=2692869 RepID=UPI001683EB09|nr:mechanosensitive ion channel family protein [Trichocoleus sp. FACHB-262]MBD2123772.1 mechanosensitive ion channel family protein [Trichocoleus sp. FACHB-262]
MSFFQWNIDTKVRGCTRSSHFRGVMAGAIALSVLPTSLLPASAQSVNAQPATTQPVTTQPTTTPLTQTLSPNVQKLDSLLTQLGTQGDSAEVATSEVRLDGRTLFSIALPVVGQKPGQPIPIKRRGQDIETILQRIANSRFDPNKLQVTSAIDEQSGLPVIYVNDQWLMTVTTLDAQFQGRDPERWANRLTAIIRNALIQAQQERQPQFLLRQALIADGIGFAVIISSYGLNRLQRRFRAKQIRLQAQIPTQAEVLSEAVSAADPTSSEGEQIETVAAVQHQFATRQQRNVYDIKHRLVDATQVGLWGGSTYIILGLFPYSRWLQPLLFSAPLQVLGVGLLTYVVIRTSEVLIDQFFDAIAEGELLAPEASQRLALRVSTFSRVLKSVATIVFTFAGGLVALSVVGVDLVPLLAGAGIIGLAISFASQSIIKDMINGFLILLEDQYAVGDVITVGEVSGFVENMNLRITQLRNNEGRLITIPNSAIAVVQNLSKDWSRVDIAIDVAYGTDPDRALEVIGEVGQEMYRDRDWRGKLPEPPEVLGIDELDHTGILIRVWIKTEPLQQWKVAREFRRRLKYALDEAGIELGSPQQALWFRSSHDLADPAFIATDGQPQQLQSTGSGRNRSY